jgi:epoxyqueuosine reductase
MEWLRLGYAGQMQYFADRQEAYQHPGHVLNGTRSLLMLAMLYHTEPPEPTGPLEGRVARYAWGAVDYHDLIRDRLHQLADYLRQLVPGAEARGVVDTAPLLEREFAQLAGLGWIGKNTLLLSRQVGSYFFLAALLTDIVLDYDAPTTTDHCGTCTACLDACPTQAFPRPYVLDATRCISYLTIEMHDAVDHTLRPGMGDWVFGCDVCQEVCPWNRKAPASAEQDFAPLADMNPLDLAPLFEMDDAAFRARFHHTPLWRAHRRGLLRNAAIALGNRRDPTALPILEKALAEPEPVVRGAAAWALGRLGLAEAAAVLRTRRTQETDASVIAEIEAAQVPGPAPMSRTR